MKRLQFIYPNEKKALWTFSFVLTTTAAIYLFFRSYLHFKGLEVSFPFFKMFISVFGSCYLFLIFIPIIIFLKNKYDILERRSYALLHLLLAFVVATIFIFIVSLFNHIYLNTPLGLVDRFYYSWSADFLTVFIAYISILAIAYALHYFLKFKKASAVLVNPEHTAIPQQHLSIKNKGQIIKVAFKEVSYIQALDNYIKIHTSKQSFLVRKTLKKMEAELLPHGFVRIHRSYLVNSSHAEKATKHNNGDIDIQLKSSQVLRMSRNYNKNLSLIFQE